ncbi:gastrula zinc finger protein XlCGF46.1-like [Pollicipes pollicipes]|uniref:gastrula zinc finger protein XlCGF46.1-like n=1 Tax=Pollicipes pollicipes TaxID=41117 RepID=UPI001884D4DE|nr:gastrula zinc finger protein XlCGF46.1-like [Pollicipes pollicipes]
MRAHLAARPDTGFFRCEREPEGEADAEAEAAGSADESTALACDVCQVSFASRRNLNRHRAQHDGGARFACEECDRSYARLDDLTRHSVEAHRQERRFRCPRCVRSFTQKRIVDYHLRSHAGDRRTRAQAQPPPVRYHCEECATGFDTRRRFLRHLQLRHDQATPRYGCELCDATYARIDELTRHTMHVHGQKRTVPCPRCSRRFTQQRIVDYHVTGHDTKRVYVKRCVCDICGRRISCPQALRRHRLLHSDERPAKCPTCAMAFIDDVALAKHVLTHSEEKPFLCDHCGKGFRFKDYLLRHTRFHTGERPYACSGCDKRFATSDTLNRHFLIHTGEKPFVCHVCQRPFRQSQQLKTHMKVHERKELLLVLDAPLVPAE